MQFSINFEANRSRTFFNLYMIDKTTMISYDSGHDNNLLVTKGNNKIPFK